MTINTKQCPHIEPVNKHKGPISILGTACECVWLHASVHAYWGVGWRWGWGGPLITGAQWLLTWKLTWMSKSPPKGPAVFNLGVQQSVKSEQERHTLMYQLTCCKTNIHHKPEWRTSYQSSHFNFVEIISILYYIIFFKAVTSWV